MRRRQGQDAVGIICTLGPASSRKETLLGMMREGMSVARLNFSHGTHEEHLSRIQMVRALNRRHGHRTLLLGDLEGYRTRVGRLKGGRPVSAEKGRTLYLAQGLREGRGVCLPFDWQGSLERIPVGQHIYIDDGRILLVVEDRKDGFLKTRVVIPGMIREHKGINMPGVSPPLACLTAKDREDIDFCLAHQVDWIAQSFVSRKRDMTVLRQYIRRSSGAALSLIAKIENRQGIRRLDGILCASEGIMVARGDLGISIPVYEVPIVQKEMIRKCLSAGRFVITATHMLESMTENLIPQRSEVSDVANAILDGSDYVMLSAETAVGKYPVESVAMMRRIAEFTLAHGKTRASRRWRA